MTETGSNVGPSEQAQPTNIPSAERAKSSSSGGSGQAPTDSNQTPSPNKSITFSQTVSSSQSGTLSGASGTSSSSSGGPNTSSSSGTTSSGSGYPPSSSHSSDSPEEPPSNDHRGSPGSDGGGGGKDSSQQPPSGSDENSEQSKEKGDSSIGKDNVETNISELDNSIPQENVRQPSLDQPSQTEGTQDSFLKRKDNSSSLSSREGGESGYIGGSSSVSVLASVSPSKSTPGSLSVPSVPLVSVSDSQETLESSISCIEDSVPLTNTAQSQAKPAYKTANTCESAQAVPSSDNEVAPFNKLKGLDGTPDQPKQGEKLETNEDQVIATKVSSELLPLEEPPPHSPELLDDDVIDGGSEDGKQDTTNSPVIALQVPRLPRDSDSTNTADRAESPVIALQSPPSKRAISKSTQLVPIEVDPEEPGSSRAMDIDMISTQNSFVLQLADSQCTLTPFSSFKQSQQKLIEAEDSRKDKGSVENSKQDDKDSPELQQGNANEQKDTDNTSAASLVNEPVSEGAKSPLNSIVKSKPIPLYESLLYEDSNSLASMNSPQIQTKQTGPSSLSHPRLSELQDTSQITNSGKSMFLL